MNSTLNHNFVIRKPNVSAKQRIIRRNPIQTENTVKHEPRNYEEMDQSNFFSRKQRSAFPEVYDSQDKNTKQQRQTTNEQVFLFLNRLRTSLVDIMSALQKLTKDIEHFENKTNPVAKHETRHMTKWEQEHYAKMMLHEGKKPSDIARMLGKTERTIRRWKDSYEKTMEKDKNE